ncbi:MAG TPA: tetratricopeptide repeat protein, partial [Anaeromyxobacteraceae bacterium]
EPPAPAQATPEPERVTWFAGPADEPRAPVKENEAPRDEPAPGTTEPPPVPVPEGGDRGDGHAPRIVRFPPRVRHASPTPTPSELGVRWEEDAAANGAARAPQPRQVPSRRSRRAELGLALAVGALVLGLGGAWVARGRSAPQPQDLYRSALVAARRDRQAGHLGAAIDGYRRALGAVETSAAQAELGLALRDAGQLDAAVEALRRALALDAGNGSAYIALGEICLRDHRLEDARSAYQHYLALEPEGEHAAEARAALAGMR